MVEISGTTKLIGLFADPIAQVRTPAALNPILAEAGADMIVVPLHVEKAGLEAALAGLRHVQSFAGFLATVPHKGNIPALCDHVMASARQVGAANSVRRRADGSLECATFDGIGFVGGLKGQNIEPAGKRVLLAGAGGAASAVAFAMAEAGIAELGVTNRTREKAQALADRVGAEFPAIKTSAVDPDPTGFDIVINGTSLGMSDGDPLPIKADKMGAGQLAAEVIMKPEVTPFLAQAQANGAQIHGGLFMLKGQLRAIADFLLGVDS